LSRDKTAQRLDGGAGCRVRVGPGQHLRGDEAIVADLIQRGDDFGKVQVGAPRPLAAIVANVDQPAVVLRVAKTLVDSGRRKIQANEGAKERMACFTGSKAISFDEGGGTAAKFKVR